MRLTLFFFLLLLLYLFCSVTLFVVSSIIQRPARSSFYSGGPYYNEWMVWLLLFSNGDEKPDGYLRMACLP